MESKPLNRRPFLTPEGKWSYERPRYCNVCEKPFKEGESFHAGAFVYPKQKVRFTIAHHVPHCPTNPKEEQ